jgi:hypothetical protein
MAKNPNLGKFWTEMDLKLKTLVYVFYGRLVYFTPIWYIFVMWCFFPPLWYFVPRKIWQPSTAAMPDAINVPRPCIISTVRSVHLVKRFVQNFAESATGPESG